MKMKSKLTIVALAFVGGLVGAFFFTGFLAPQPVTEIIREVPAQVENANYANYNSYGASAASLVDFRDAAEASVHSVVYIKNLQRSRRSQSYFEMLFGGHENSSDGSVAIGSGSGVIYSSDGYIITNNHVIKGADAIEVQHEKRTYKAKLVGTDPKMDIAVLKIDADNLPSIDIATSSEVRVGDWVLAVGNPFNLTSTVTAGIVSAIGSSANSVRENFPIELYIQTDAAINPGNSGGALVNTNGELIGINTSIISRTGSYAGYGFAVPSDVVVKIVEDLKKYRVVQKAYTGAEVDEIDEDLAKEYGIRSLEGVFINSIRRSGAADKAGLEPGDVVKRIDNRRVITKASFDEIINAKSPGDEVAIEYQRDNRTYQTSLTLENILGNTEILDRDNSLDENDIYFSDYLGAEFRNLTAGEKENLNIRYGALITKINPDNGFFRKLDDIEEGEIVLAVNGRYVASARGLAKYIEDYYGRIYFDIIDDRGNRRRETYRFN